MAYGWFMDDLWMVMAVGLNSVYQPRKSRLPPSASLTLQPWHDGCEPVGDLATAVATQVWLVYPLVMADIAMKAMAQLVRWFTMIYLFSKRWFSIVMLVYQRVSCLVFLFSAMGWYENAHWLWTWYVRVKPPARIGQRSFAGILKFWAWHVLFRLPSISLDDFWKILTSSDFAQLQAQCHQPCHLHLPWLFLDQGHRRPKILLRLFGNLGSSLILPVATWQVLGKHPLYVSSCFYFCGKKAPFCQPEQIGSGQVPDFFGNVGVG